MKLKLLILNFSMLLPHINFAGNGSFVYPHEWKSISRIDFSKILQKMNRTYDRNISFSVEVTHSSYKDYSSRIPSDQVKGFICRNGNMMRSKLLGIQTIINSNYKVVIDSASRVIILSNPEKISGTLISKEDMLENMNLCSSIEYFEEKEISVYRMSFDENYPYKYVDFSINNSGLVQKMEFFMNVDIKDNSMRYPLVSKPRVEINCENYALAVSFPESYFDEGKYLRFLAGKPVPTEEYAQYKIIDLRKSNN
jgi:hypothetical protein